jgi:uncharacterized protein (TIGR00299 family) protein
MARVGYLDLASGLAGDMLLGALVDAGWAVDALRETIGRLGLGEEQWAIESEAVMKGAIRACAVRARVAEGRSHRHLHEIEALIRGGRLSSSVAERAVAVFHRLAQAEAKVHGSRPEKIHFHEVGALDAILDIVGAVAGLEALGIERLYAGAVPLGEGWAESEHGRIPVPAPAALELLTAAEAPTRVPPGAGELVTPTGAALLAELATFEQPAMQLSGLGTGAGTKDLAWPNIVRLRVGEALDGDGAERDRLVRLATNIDDMSPQLFEAGADRLFEAGALDVWLHPIQMKKQRPGVLVEVLAPASEERALAEVLLRETTTLGVRVEAVHRRHVAERGHEEVETPFGKIRVKTKRLNGAVIGATPEYEDCAALAARSGVATRRIYEAALAAGQSLLSS